MKNQKKKKTMLTNQVKREQTQYNIVVPYATESTSVSFNNIIWSK